MPEQTAAPSARQTALLEAAYRYALANGLTGLSLRPLAEQIGSSPRVLLYLFGSKDGLVRALLARARVDELTMLSQLGVSEPDSLADAALRVWGWLADPEHRGLLTLWLEAYSRSLIDPTGPWAGFAEATVADWLEVLAAAQHPPERVTPAGVSGRTTALAVLRGGLLDLLATGEEHRVGDAVSDVLASLT